METPATYHQPHFPPDPNHPYHPITNSVACGCSWPMEPPASTPSTPMGGHTPARARREGPGQKRWAGLGTTLRPLAVWQLKQARPAACPVPRSDSDHSSRSRDSDSRWTGGGWTIHLESEGYPAMCACPCIRRHHHRSADGSYGTVLRSYGTTCHDCSRPFSLTLR